jgi:hypothetical protein
MFSRYVVTAAFYINQSYIAQNLCENRDKPQLQCNGHCQLSKKLKDEQRKEQENPERKAENKSEIFYPAHESANNMAAAFRVVDRNYILPISIGMPVDQAQSVFHPPAA